ncbi:cell division protein FtsQ [Marinococcus sp. PL1-022]|uniref:cell division protein FtsQ n=1 Tax=Marinococcus sp. PL1-022 TaxID=3095363 RepID=UPI0029C4D0A7|nr:cell division protein FtsQ [Marinococcus sp. PL1-022]MDX6152786.1 cell division protein FtsQ [Marinococcus sp. PL1-022]
MEATKRTEYTQSQKMMVFILSMSLFGLANLFTELLPEFTFGPIELSISYLAFIPLTLVMLFNPLYAAFGASVGEIIFGDLLLGDFGGLGELEGFIEFTLAMYIAGLLVTNLNSRKQIALAAATGVLIDQMLSTVVDVGKVWFGIEEVEAVPGLPASILAIEGVSFVTEMLISGILFGIIPVMYLIPKLYGRIEPLLGIEPRQGRVKASMTEWISVRFVILSVFLMFVAIVSEFMAEMDINFAVWQPEFLEQFGEGYIWLPISAAAIVLIAVVSLGIQLKRTKTKDQRRKSA